MSWSQSYFVEQVDRFLARLVDLDIDKLIADETMRRMAERGLRIVKVEDAGRIDDMYGPEESLARVTLSDGRVFVHKLVRSETSDDYGHEDWEFCPEDEETVVEKRYRDPGNPDDWEER